MRSLCCLILMFQIAGLPALAGAWLREAGTSFTALSYGTTYFGDTANTTYLEFGLRGDLTFGVDLGYFTDHTGAQTGAATVFVRRPLGRTDARHKWAYELGAGAIWDGAETAPHLMTGLSWGRGFQIGDRYGWMAVDGSVKWDLTRNRHTIKFDSTIGFNFTDVTAGMLQVFLAASDGQTSAKLAPSVIVKPRRGSYRFQIGFESPLDDFGNSAVKLGLWRDF